MLWSRGRSLFSYVVAVMTLLHSWGEGILEIVLKDYCFRRIHKILGFQGQFVDMVASVRE